MTTKCEWLHHLLDDLPLMQYPFDIEELPDNGVYFFYEDGEFFGHGSKDKPRIVRIGTHREGNFKSRMRDHFLFNKLKMNFDKTQSPPHDRSIFRTNLGRAILNKEKNDYLKIWNLDFTTKKNRTELSHLRNIPLEKKIETQFLGYYLKWIPQENFYYAVENTDFQVNTERIEGTYQKYAGIDDKIEGYFYYTAYIKFGYGRAMSDSTMEVRNGHITKEEGLGLIKQFDGEFPKKYEKEILEYISMTREEFDELCDKFRPDHIWEKKSNRWELKNTPWEYFDKKNNS